jgi:hypothetical protein
MHFFYGTFANPCVYWVPVYFEMGLELQKFVFLFGNRVPFIMV